ncbi:MAG: hydroxyisourate hydrolase [Bdellovibrionia bacterium]
MISTHVLDTSKGNPAGGIPVKLQKKVGVAWSDVAAGVTNSDGRHAFDGELAKGVYQITFEVGPYLKGAGDSFYESIPVVFKIENTGRKYHVPLLLNPFGYSTYRGS